MTGLNSNGKLAQLPVQLRETQDSLLDLEALLAVSKVIHSTFNIAELFSLIVEQAISLTDTDRGCLITTQAEGKIQIEVAQHKSGRSLPVEDFRISHTIVDEVMATHLPLIREDIWNDDFLKCKDSITELGLRRVLCAPLIRDQDIVGLIYVDSVGPSLETLSQRRLRTLDALAGQAAVALYQARLYKELESLYEITRILDAAKTDFIAIASHELRTPLALINGYVEILGSMLPELGEQVRPFVEGITNGTTRLIDVVSSMLYAAQVDQSNLKLHLQPYSIKALCKEVVDKWREASRERSLRFEISFHVPEEDRLIWTIDVGHLEHALGHLLANAIKFTPDEGLIEVQVRKANESLEIDVIDSGIGVEPQYRELIFEKFFRAHDSRLHSTGKTKFMGAGPGLGLYLARGIVAAHGGTVWVEPNPSPNEDQAGSKFVIRLPGIGPANCALEKANEIL
ncbi:MAG: hypothetical protein BroJett011_59460 [Chloroflexota bacterium]|nr:MAG: hypothetical protein BroJett011_59460 [Chloroflexota bacterium]